MSTEIATPAGEVTAEALTIAERASGLRIVDRSGLEVAAELLGAIKAMATKAREIFDPICEAAHKAHKVATAKRAEVLDPLTKAETVVKSRVVDFRREEERLLRIEQERQAREQAAANAKAEAARIAEERRLLGERAAEAERLADSGDVEAGLELLAAPAPVVAPVVQFVPPPPAPVAKVAGIGTGKEWTFEILDDALIPRQFCRPEPALIRAFVKAFGGQAVIPGVRVFEEFKISNRRFSTGGPNG